MYTPVKYTFVELNNDNIHINLEVMDCNGKDTLNIIISVSDLFYDESLESESSSKDAYSVFCEKLNNKLDCSDSCPDVFYKSIKGYKTAYQKACTECKTKVIELWNKENK